MENSKGIVKSFTHWKLYIWGFAVGWTLFVIAFLVWDLIHDKEDILEQARIEARTAFERDIIYRQWNAKHGGVYVPVTPETQPNPYLSHIPERDITTPSGKLLTFINPAYMTRQVYELTKEGYDFVGHITSLNPIRHENSPDPWETKALQAFERGETEISSTEEMKGKIYMRLMRPLITEKACLRCHEAQGYKEGDVRGGISISIPMEPLLAIEHKNLKREVLIYVLGWLIGLISIGLAAQQISKRERLRKQSEDALRHALEESRQRQAEISALLEGSRAVLEYLDFKESARSIFDYCKNLIGATAGYIALLSKGGEENEVLFLDSGGLPCTVDRKLPMPIRGLREEAYRIGKTVYDNDFPKSEYMKFMPEGHVTLHNVLFAPLVIEGKTVGVLGLANKAGGFTENDAQLALAFGSLAAIALRNSRTLESLKNREAEITRLYQQAQDEARRAEGLRRIGEAINSNLDLDMMLQTITDQTKTITETDYGEMLFGELDGGEGKNHFRKIIYSGFDPASCTVKVKPSLKGLVGEIFHTRITLRVDDLSKHPHSTPLPEGHPEIGPFLGVPILVGGKCVAQILLTRVPGSPPFTDFDEQAAVIVANQAAVAIQNAQLYEQIKTQRVEEQTTLLRLSQEFLATLEPQEIMRRTVLTAADALNTDYAGLMLLDEDEKTLTLGFSKGREKLIGRLQSPNTDDNFVGYIMRRKTPLIIEDTARDGRFPVPALVEQEGTIASALGVPVLVGEKPLGVLIVDTQKQRPFSPDEERFLSLISNQTGIALEKASLFHSLTERNRRLRRLYELAILMTGDITRVADQVVTIIAELLDIKVSLVERLEDETILTITMYDHGKLVHEGKFPLKDTPCERVKVDKKQCNYNNHVAELFPKDPFFQERGLVAYIGVPILDSQGEVIGVVNAMDDRPRDFSPDDLTLLSTFAHRIGVEIERAKVEKLVDRRNKELAALYGITSTVSRSLDVDRILNDALDELLRLEPFKAEVGAKIFLLDMEKEMLTVAASRRIPTDHPCHKPVKLGECLCGLAAKKGELIISETAHLDERHTRRWPNMPPHKDVCAPIKYKDKVFGVLDIWLPTTTEVTEEEITLLKAIGNQIGVAIENARLFQETHRRAGELSAIAEVGGLLTSGDDFQITLDTLANKIAQTTGFEAVGIGLYDEEHEVLTYNSLYSNTNIALLSGRKGTTIPLSDASVLQYLLREKKPLLLEDPQNDPRVPVSQRELARRDGVHTVLTMPLLFQQELVGVLDLISTRRRTLTPGDHSLLTTLSDQVSVAIYNARLYQQAKQRLSRLTILGEVHRSISSTLDLNKILNILQENVNKVSHGDTITVMLIRSGSDELETIGKGTLRLKIGEGAAGWVAKEGIPLAITDVQTDPRFLYKDLAIKTGIVSYLGVPIKSKGKVIGVLNLSAKNRYEFTTEELDFLTTMCGEAAVAIENARLYGQIEKRAQELNRDLLGQKQYAENVLRSITDGVYTVDRNRVVQSWSKGAEFITGYTAEGAIGRPCSEFLHHTDEAGQVLCDTDRCPFKQVWATSEPIRPEPVFLHHKNGNKLPVAVTAASILDEQGQATGAVEVFRDVSKEQELIKNLQEASRAKSEFLTKMSHELRTPLNSVIGFAQVLLREHYGPLTDKQKEYLRDIYESGNHLLSLINDILDLSKIEVGKLTLEIKKIALEPKIERALVFVREKAIAHGISLETKISEDLPEVFADERAVLQILVNLLSNAVKFTPDGGRVEIKSYPQGDFVAVDVLDTGMGIAIEDQEKIFRLFEQLSVSSPYKREGTGLGLSIAQSLVTAMGGIITVKSDLSKGSCFTFTLPITRD